MSETREGITADSASWKAPGGTDAPRAAGIDAAVIDALRRGDEEAFTRLVEQHQQTLLRIARLYVSSAAIAEEAVQDTWLAVIRGIWAFEGRSSLKTWILRILINRSKTRAVREGRMVPFPEAGLVDSATPGDFAGAAQPDDAADAFERSFGSRGDATELGTDIGHGVDALRAPGASPEARLLNEEARLRIRAAIDALPLNQRIVITMRDLEGCSSEEVCNALGLSETNQRVILHRARSKIRTVLTPPIGKR